MKRRNLFHQAIDDHLPDRENILQTVLSEAASPVRRRFPAKRAAAAALAAVLLVTGFGAIWHLAGRTSEKSPEVVETAQLHLFASGNTSTPERALELEPNVEVKLSMWGIWRDYPNISDKTGKVESFEIRKEQQSALGVQGEGLQSYTISCDNGKLVYYPDSYQRLSKLLFQNSGQPADSRYMSCIFLPPEIPYQDALAHAQAGDAAYFENILKDHRYQFLRDHYFEGGQIDLSGCSFSILQSSKEGAVFCALRADWTEDPLPRLAGRSITVLRPQENAMINWEPNEEDYRKIYEPGPFSYEDFGSATITVTAQFESGKQVEKHLFVYFSEDGYQTVKLLD